MSVIEYCGLCRTIYGAYTCMEPRKDLIHTNLIDLCRTGLDKVSDVARLAVPLVVTPCGETRMITLGGGVKERKDCISCITKMYMNIGIW